MTHPARALAAVLAAGALAAQVPGPETPRANRLPLFSIFPEPLPDGRSGLGMEVTSQFFRPDMERSADGRTGFRLDGEEWGLVGDGAVPLAGGRLALRLRLVHRSGGVLDQAFWSWHGFFGVPQGGREEVGKYRMDYHLERDGRTLAELRRPTLRLQEADLAWVRPFGSEALGARLGVGVQLPMGKFSDFSGSGGTDLTAGGAAWTASGPWRAWAQAERVVLGLPRDSPLKAVLAHRAYSRGWVGLGYQGQQPGLVRGLGLEVSLGVTENPYALGLARMDRPGWQQHWTFRHRALPGWSFGFSEEAGTYAAPDITFHVGYRRSLD